MAGTNEIPAENEASLTPTGKDNPIGRRIVKAATPKATDGTNGGFTFASPTTDKNNDEDDSLLPIKKNDDLDDQDKWRNDRLKATEKRGKALREKELQARRATAVSEQANASGNPFSRFLSAFSVDAKNPEHKRSYEATSEEELEGPSEKRLKQSESCDPDYGNSGDGSNDGGSNRGSLFSSKAFWVTTAITVALGVALALQRGRKK